MRAMFRQSYPVAGPQVQIKKTVGKSRKRCLTDNWTAYSTSGAKASALLAVYGIWSSKSRRLGARCSPPHPQVTVHSRQRF